MIEHVCSNVRFGSCVDGSDLASVYLMFLRIGWVLSCVRPVDAAFAGRWP